MRVSTQWEWSVNLYKYLCTTRETIHKEIQEHRMHKTENKLTKQENTHEKNIKKNISRVIRK